MATFALPLVQLVRENLSTLIDFAFARPSLVDLVDNNVTGEWKHFRTMLFDISEERAAKAAIELAVFLRLLDDRDDISSYINRHDWNFGALIARDGGESRLKMRDVSNKIIHSAGLAWDFSKEGDPVLICKSQAEDKWLEARIRLVALAVFCGGFIAA